MSSEVRQASHKERLAQLIEEINGHIKDARVAEARAVFYQAQGLRKKELNKLFGPLIMLDRFPRGHAKYPVVLGDGRSVANCEVLVKLRDTPSTHNDLLPPSLLEPIKTALRDSGKQTELNYLEVSFFPPLILERLTQEPWRSHPSPRVASLSLSDSNSYSAALYIAVRTAVSPESRDQAPLVTGCLKDTYFDPPAQSMLNLKAQVIGGEYLLSPQPREQPRAFYHRIFSKEQRTVTELEHELNDTLSLLKSEKEQLFIEAYKALQEQSRLRVLTPSSRRNFYLNTMRLASHIDRLEDIDNELLDHVEREYELAQYPRIYFEYVCLRINKQLENFELEALLEMTQELLQKYFKEIDLRPTTDEERRGQPIELGTIWNTLAQASLFHGEVEDALTYVNLAIDRNQDEPKEFSYSDDIRFRCRKGQILGIVGESKRSVEELERALTLLDHHEIQEHREIQRSRPFVLAYLARAYAQLHRAEDAQRALKSSRYLHGSSDLRYIKFEVEMILSGLRYIDFNQVYNQWTSARLELLKDARLMTKLSVDRVDRLVRRAQERLEAIGDPIGGDHTGLNSLEIYQEQVLDIDLKRCSPY